LSDADSDRRGGAASHWWREGLRLQHGRYPR